ncbi:hypothetical protein HAX54_029699, partial [Datura stramonium]|nr:hypothetical protein [Datura stramonium]
QVTTRHPDRHLEQTFGKIYLSPTMDTMDRQACDGLSLVPSDASQSMNFKFKNIYLG